MKNVNTIFVLGATPELPIGVVLTIKKEVI